MAVALDLHVLADRDGARPGDAAQVVAPEVDEHDVLGPLLRVALELLRQERVLARVRAARASAGDRVGRQPVALDLEEELRRGADDLEGRRPDEEQVRARVDPAEGAVQPDPVERRAGRRVRRQLERLAPGEDDLDRLAGRDRVLGDLHGVDVLVATEAGLDRAAGRLLRRRRRRRPSAELDGRRALTPSSSAALGREVRSSASKIAASAIR